MKSFSKTFILVVFAVMLAACGIAETTSPPSTAIRLLPSPTETATPLPSNTNTPLPSTPIAELTITPAAATVTLTDTASPTNTPLPPIPYPELSTSASLRTYGDELNDMGYDILLLDDGGTLIVGRANNTGLSHRIFPGKARLIRTDAEGEVIWEKDYGGELDSMFYSPIQVGEDAYVILGQIAASYERDEEDMYLVKIDGDGNQIWSQTYGGRGMDHSGMVRQTSDGGFILVGGRADEFPTGDLFEGNIVLIKTDAEGNEVWTRTYGDQILYLGWGVAQTPDGGYLLTGWEAKTIPDRDVIAIKTNAIGDLEWSRTWDLDPGDRDGGFDLILTSDGHIVIAGIQSMDSGPRRAVLIKVDLDGNEIWVKNFGEDGVGNEFWDIMEDSDGGYIMAGDRLQVNDLSTGEANRSGLVIKTDPDGKVLWQYLFGGDEYEQVILSSAVVLPNDAYIFVGQVIRSGERFSDMLWLKLTTDGEAIILTPEPESTSSFEPSACKFEYNTPVEVECGYLIVPENRRKPDSPMIRIHIAIFKSTNPDPKPDPVIYVAGGGGVNQLGSADFYLNGVGAEILQERDFIMYNQRGAHLNKPSLVCPDLTGFYRELALQDLTLHEKADRRIEKRLECHDDLLAQEIDLTAYNTVETAADINDLRNVLGYDEVNLYGTSSGTRTILTVMRYHPERIRSVILDSVYPPQVGLYSTVSLSVERVFSLIFEKCAADPECNQKYPDLEGVFYQVVDQLNANHLNVELYQGSGRVLVNGGFFMEALYNSFFSLNDIALVPARIDLASQGNLTSLVHWFESLITDTGTFMAMGFEWSMMCNEEVPFESYELGRQLAASLPPQIAEYFDSYYEFSLCESWQAGQADPVENMAVLSDIPALVLAGGYDPVTPPEWGRMAAETLSSHFYYEFPDLSHGIMRSNACGVDIGLQFINDPNSEPDSACMSQVPVIDFK